MEWVVISDRYKCLKDEVRASLGDESRRGMLSDGRSPPAHDRQHAQRCTIAEVLVGMEARWRKSLRTGTRPQSWVARDVALARHSFPDLWSQGRNGQLLDCTAKAVFEARSTEEDLRPPRYFAKFLQNPPSRLNVSSTGRAQRRRHTRARKRKRCKGKSFGVWLFSRLTATP